MSNSGSGKRKAGKSKAGKSKAGTMEVVESDDEDEEFEADEDEEESNENVTGGMRLLRRGMVTMSRVNRRLVRGRKLKVKYNDDGEPVGRAAKEMQSYIGVFARTKQAPRKYGRKKTKQWVDTDKDDDDLEHLPADLPPALLSLSKWALCHFRHQATLQLCRLMYFLCVA
ncbi:hypothetical protein ACLB2K_026357 [Fragaria x ananassa]